MFENEVMITEEDKKRLIELLTEADEILKKYPFVSKTGHHTVTMMSRAKTCVADGRQWCQLLYTESNDNN